MAQPAYIIARFTFFEAVRNRLFPLVIISLVCILGLTEFIGELAITETRQIQSALTASGLRLFTVCVLGLFVVTSMVREFNDKGFEMLLSLAITRASYYAGKIIGFALLALTIILAASLILLIYSPAADVLRWSCSLACESLIIIALSLLCLFTFSSITTAFMVVIAFYLLSRSMHVIQLISASPIVDTNAFSQSFIDIVINAIAFALPDLHLFSRSEWLIYGSDLKDLSPVLIQTAIYLLFLAGAGLFDLYRKEL
jgi:ABC-type transport system involved in multi-copper enzyme maturation permease subunit